MLQSTAQLLTHFKVLSDPVRLRLFVLCANAECSVSELRSVTGLSQPRVSQHLKQLTAAGLIERFRDGQFVFYRVGMEGAVAAERRRLLALVPADDPVFGRDISRLRDLRGSVPVRAPASADRALYQALVELAVSAPIGNLLDIGSGDGGVLKLLASRARRAVGLDTDPDARRYARRELALAGLPNCTVRQGSMYELAYADGEFDTVILDDVLGDADEPLAALGEARRVLRPGGRLVVLARADGEARHDVVAGLAGWCSQTGLMVGAPRRLAGAASNWVMAVAGHALERAAIA